MIVEDAAESFCAAYNGIQTGCFGDVSILSANGNKLVTGSSGGLLLTDDLEWADKARKWSTQSRENAPWYQHEEVGYNYRMSNIIAGVLRGQLPYAEEHRRQKKAIYERYREKLKDLPVTMNPVGLDGVEIEANYWLSCLLINKEAMCRQVRGGAGGIVCKRAWKELPDGDLGGIGGVQCGGKADLEADAYAADLPDESVCDQGREWTGKDECVSRWLWR